MARLIKSIKEIWCKPDRADKKTLADIRVSKVTPEDDSRSPSSGNQLSADCLRKRKANKGGIRGVIRSALRIIVLAYVGFGTILLLFQSRFIYFPDSRVDTTPKEIGLDFEDVYLTATDGVQIHGWFVPADRAAGAVLVCHGNAGNIADRLYTISLLNGMGMDVFIFDYRGYGNSQGSPAEAGTYLDTEAAWRHLTEQRGLKDESIVIFGRSLGGSIAAHLARDCHPAGLIVESAFTSIPDLAARMYPIFPTRLLSRFDYNTREYVARTRCPVLVIHSKDDELIPFSHGRHIFEAANEPKRFLEITGGHNDGFMTSSGVYREAIESFLTDSLTEAQQSH